MEISGVSGSLQGGNQHSLAYALECALRSAVANRKYGGTMLARTGQVPNRSRYRRMMDMYPDEDKHTARREAQERLMLGNARVANPG
ncbi:MAG: hypothetical protein WAQ05_17025 [Rubrivivax sp.]